MSAKFPYAERARRAREANQALGDASLARRRIPGGGWDRDHSSFSEWERCVEAFWAAMRDALPAEFWSSAEQVRQGDPAGAELLIEFLEADPYYFRSGYLKADALRWLGRIRLNETQKNRLRAVVLKATKAGWRREFRRYCTFARQLDTPAFRSALSTLASSSDGGTMKRAQRVLDALDGVPSIWHEWQARQRMSAEEQRAAIAKSEAERNASALRRFHQRRHQMDAAEIQAELEFMVLLGSVEAEELLRQLPRPGGARPDEV